tara:strand:+ start:7358 stop:7957 length:600 start_codon:yes stop_codon:yes gene_type:complete
MQESLYYLWQITLAYPASAFVVLLIILVSLFLVVSHMQVFFFRIIAMSLGSMLFIGLLYLLWPQQEEKEFVVAQPSTLGLYEDDSWDLPEKVAVISLDSLLKTHTCEFKKGRELKSMKSGFFIPLAQTYDLLLFKKSAQNFMLQVRERAQGHVIKTVILQLKRPLVFKVNEQHYQVFYEYTDGVASVISVTPCTCTKQV